MYIDQFTSLVEYENWLADSLRELPSKGGAHLIMRGELREGEPALSADTELFISDFAEWVWSL